MNRERTDQKLRYAQIMLDELRTYSAAHSNDEWENAHQEAFFYHLAGSCEGILHEINECYELRLSLKDVRQEKVSHALCGQLSAAFEAYCAQRSDSTGWMSLLFEFRNHGTHRTRVSKVVHASTNSNPDNEFIDPRSGKPQEVYKNLRCTLVMEKMFADATKFIQDCRSADTKLIS